MGVLRRGHEVEGEELTALRLATVLFETLAR